MIEEKVYTPKPVLKPVQFGPNPLTQVISAENHARLMQHLIGLCAQWEHERRRRIAQMEQTEIDLLGLVLAQGPDCARKKSRKKGEGAAVPDAIYPFGYLALQEFATQIAATVFPAEAPYAVAAAPSFRQQGQALVQAFRHQGLQFDHRNNIHATLFDMIALDLGAAEFSWSRISAMGQPTAPTGGAATAPAYAEGMKIRARNPYNVCWDMSLDPERVPLEGEFIAFYDRVSTFSLRRHNNLNNWLSPDNMRLLTGRTKEAGHFMEDQRTPPWADAMDNAGCTADNLFYHKPSIAAHRDAIVAEHGSNRSRSENMSGIFSGAIAPHQQRLDHTVHEITMYVRLRGSEYGLSKDKNDTYKVWKVVILGHGILASAEEVQAEVDRIPAVVATMNYNKDRGRSFSLGEHAAQLGLYISSLLNLHKRSMRKGLNGGLTVFNPNVFNLKDVDDISDGKVAAKMNTHDDDIRRHIAQFTDMPDTKRNLADAEAIMGMLSRFLPANAQPAMMGLDRATQYQAQAVMLTSLQQTLWYASLIDGQLMVPARFFMHHWNVLNVDSLTYFDETKKQLLKLEDVKAIEFALVSSQPLMGHDRLRTEVVLRDLMNIMLQSGGVLSPVSETLLRHYLPVASINLSMEDFDAAIQKQQEQLAAQQNAENTPGSGAALPTTQPTGV